MLPVKETFEAFECQAGAAKKEKSSDTKLPHIANLNEDLREGFAASRFQAGEWP